MEKILKELLAVAAMGNVLNDITSVMGVGAVGVHIPDEMAEEFLSKLGVPVVGAVGIGLPDNALSMGILSALGVPVISVNKVTEVAPRNISVTRNVPVTQPQPKSPKPSGYWTIDRIRAEARKYKSRNEFKNGNRGAYDAAHRMGLMNAIFPKY